MPEIAIALMSGPQDGDVLTFETLLDPDRPTEITIGRREDCDLCLSYDSQVSREHAVVIYDGDTFWLQDTGSTNGTFIEDDRITTRTPVKPGQLFRIGRTWMRVEPLARFRPLDLLDPPEDLPF